MIPPGKFSSLHREGRTRRRDFVAGTAAAVGATLCTNAVRAVELGRARTISIFHTTDLHGRILPTSSYEGLDDVGGFARCASCIRQWRRESPHSITVDVGDVVQGTAVSMQSGGRLMIDLFNRLGYDAWALGNHDFDWGPEKLEVLLAASSAPILTANITRGGRPPGGLAGGWAKVRPWIIREVGGFRIGLIGLITPGLDFWLSAETLGGVEATDPAATLAATVKEVRDAGADAVVALGHMGWRFHDDYANPVRTVLRAAEPGTPCTALGATPHAASHRSSRFACAMRSLVESIEIAPVPAGARYGCCMYGCAVVRRCARMSWPRLRSRAARSAPRSMGATTTFSPGPGSACASTRPSKSTTIDPPGQENGG